jgi:hypothetical protein
MARSIQLYISSSPSLQPEREVVGQVVAELPLDIGWDIGHTPYSAEDGSQGELRAASCDLYVLVLGHDFAAPMGAEYRQAKRAGCAAMAYRKEYTRSPSAVEAVRRLDLAWRAFSEPDELRRLLRRDLLQALLQRAGQLGLALDELERLSRLLKNEGGPSRDRGGQAGRGEAGHSGVILGREIWEESR